ncbi:MAG: hypothetical protein KC462_09070 [Cyanobacteria bacterium HKST-UBA05]|nr:hypothetical protein [Cyanobacteria bacterium HKST-UBA05]
MGVPSVTTGHAPQATKAGVAAALQGIRNQINGLDPAERKAQNQYADLLRQANEQPAQNPFNPFPNLIPGLPTPNS